MTTAMSIFQGNLIVSRKAGSAMTGSWPSSWAKAFSLISGTPRARGRCRAGGAGPGLDIISAAGWSKTRAIEAAAGLLRSQSSGWIAPSLNSSYLDLPLPHWLAGRGTGPIPEGPSATGSSLHIGVAPPAGIASSRPSRWTVSIIQAHCGAATVGDAGPKRRKI
jgi:hypothetical protein